MTNLRSGVTMPHNIGGMLRAGLITKHYQIMTELNKQQELWQTTTHGMEYYRVLPAVFSWNTFKKRNPNLKEYSYTDRTLGIKYTVEPTMRNAGYLCVSAINETNSLGTPLNYQCKPKEFVNQWLLKNEFYQKYKECIYYVWHVRREYGSVCIDVFLK